MSALSARTDRCAARLSRLLVSSANQRSTRFSQRAAGRGEVQVKARVGGQPAPDLRGLVGRAVVEHEVHVEVLGDLLVDRLQELVELDRAVTVVQPADHLAGGEVERRVQAGGAVALVVVGRALGRAGQHRQDRLGAIQRLDLALLIHAQDDRALGRVQVQAADVIDLLDELRVGGELELLLAVRLQPERLPGRATPSSG